MAITLVALGDSTTCGLGDPMPGGGWRGFVPMLADAFEPAATFLNVAVSGARAADVRHRQLDAALQARPDVATLIVGVNDTMRSDFDPDAVRADIVQCAAALVGSGALLLTVRLHDPGRVFGLPGLLARPLGQRVAEVNAAYDEVFERFGGVRVNLATHPWTYHRECWSVDRMHPSELGHRRLARAFAEALADTRWPIAQLPSVECSGGVPPSRADDLAWLMTAGVPWLGRRARDLVPWAASLAAREGGARVLGHARRWRRIAFPA